LDDKVWEENLKMRKGKKEGKCKKKEERENKK
jgi:hypothetical protein